MDPSRPTVESLAELVMHKDGYTYGTLKGGSTHKYLMEVAKGMKKWRLWLVFKMYDVREITEE